jgi:hypothetical protein
MMNIEKADKRMFFTSSEERVKIYKGLSKPA